MVSSNYTDPFAMTEEGFPGSLSATYGPGISTVSSALINGTFIYKHKLVGLVSAYVSCKVCLFVNTTFNCDARELWNS